jgi:hypothetical protein
MGRGPSRYISERHGTVVPRRSTTPLYAINEA